jgi:peroxiredoxin family protein
MKKMSEGKKEKNKGGRPTSQVTADREWGALITDMKALSPKLMKKAMKKYSDILDSEKASESATLRACSGAFDIVKYLNDIEKRVAEIDAEEESNAEGLMAAVVAESKPMISLVAFKPEEKKVM